MARGLLLAFCGLVIFGIGITSGITCNYCYHHVYTSSDASLSAYLDGISEYDSHCLEGEDDFTPLYEVQDCSTTCLTEIGTATLSFGGSTIRFVVAQRGCASLFKTGDCEPLTIDNLVSNYGFSVKSESVFGCYCSTDYCNNGCDCEIDEGNVGSLKRGSALYLVIMTIACIWLQ